MCTDYRTFVTLFTASVDTGATASTQPRPGHQYIDRRQPGPTAVEICAGIHLLAFPELGYPVSEAVKGTAITTVHVPTERPDIPKEISYARPAQKAFTANLVAALGLHRAREPAAKVMSSAVPPAA